MDQSESTGELHISGYTFTKSHVDERGRVHWKYTKHTDLEECGERSVPTDLSKGRHKVLRSLENSKQGHQSTREGVSEDLDEDSASPKKKRKPSPRQTPAPCSKQVSGTFNRSIVQDKALSGSSPVEAPQNQLIIEDGAASNSGQREDALYKFTTQGKPLLGSNQVKDTSQQTTIPDKPPIQSDQAMIVAHQPTVQGLPLHQSNPVIAVFHQPTIQVQPFIQSNQVLAMLHQPTIRHKPLLSPQNVKDTFQKFTPQNTPVVGADQVITTVNQSTIQGKLALDSAQTCTSTQELSTDTMLSPVTSHEPTPQDLDKRLPQSAQVNATLHRPIVPKESPLHYSHTTSSAMDQDAMIVRRIGKRLYVDGYIYVRCAKLLSGVTYWVCRRFYKKNIPHKCKAKVQTIVRSSSKIVVRKGGPRVSKHNHPPMLEDVEEAESFVKPEVGKNYFYQFAPKTSTKKTVCSSNQLPFQDQCDPGINSGLSEADLVMDSLAYRQFLMAFSEQPLFDENSITRALNASYNPKHHEAAYITSVVKNREKIMDDLELLTDKPKICKMPTQDGNYALYEPRNISAEKFSSGHLTRISEIPCNVPSSREQQNSISSTQGENSGDDLSPDKVSLPIKDVGTHWSTIPEPDSSSIEETKSVNHDTPVDAKTVTAHPHHPTDTNVIYNLDKGKELASNPSSEQCQKGKVISELIPHLSSAISETLAMTSPPQPTLFSVKEQIATSSSSHSQCISRPSVIISRPGPQPIIVVTQPSQSNLSSMKEQIVTSSQNHLQGTSRPSSTISEISPKSTLATTRPSRSNLPKIKEQIIISSQDHSQGTSESSSTVSEISLKSTLATTRPSPSNFPSIKEQLVTSSQSHSQVISGATTTDQINQQHTVVATKAHQLNLSSTKGLIVTSSQTYIQGTSWPLLTTSHIGPQPTSAATQQSLSNLVNIRDQVVTSTQSHSQGISRPSVTISQIGPQSMIVSTQTPQPKLSSIKTQIVTSSQGHSQGKQGATTANHIGQQQILVATQPSQSNLSSIREQIVPSSQSHFQGISRPPLTINQVGSHLILVATQPPQSNFPSIKGQIVTNPQGYFQVVSRPVAGTVSWTGHRLTFLASQSSQSDLSGVKDQIVPSSQGHPQSVSKSNTANEICQLTKDVNSPSESNLSGVNRQITTSSQSHLQSISSTSFTISPQQIITQGVSCPSTLNVSYNNIPRIQTLNEPVITSIQVPTTENLLGLNSFITPMIGQYKSPIIACTQPIIIQNSQHIQLNKKASD